VELWSSPNASERMPCEETDLPGNLATLPGVPGQRPCLFDLEADGEERRDLGGLAASAALVREMWQALNDSVLTAYCKDTTGSSSGSTGCNRSPPALLGNCSASCAKAYWQEHWGTGEGPQCGVPGC
jgi:hypothetical protein